MFLHLGEDTVINAEEIVGIFDIDTSTISKITRDYLSKAEKNKNTEYVNYDLPKSFVVTKEKIYISPVNATTLIRRIERPNF